MSDSVTRTKPYVPKRQHIVTDERREHRQSPASPEGGSPEASPGGGWKRSDERANRHLPGGLFLFQTFHRSVRVWLTSQHHKWLAHSACRARRSGTSPRRRRSASSPGRRSSRTGPCRRRRSSSPHSFTGARRCAACGRRVRSRLSRRGGRTASGWERELEVLLGCCDLRVESEPMKNSFLYAHPTRLGTRVVHSGSH